MELVHDHVVSVALHHAACGLLADSYMCLCLRNSGHPECACQWKLNLVRQFPI
jgi:hypothetical protein